MRIFKGRFAPSATLPRCLSNTQLLGRLMVIVRSNMAGFRNSELRIGCRCPEPNFLKPEGRCARRALIEQVRAENTADFNACFRTFTCAGVKSDSRCAVAGTVPRLCKFAVL